VARSGIADYLQVYPFWLMDVAPIQPLSLPVFTPVFGFSGITAPEMTNDVYEFGEGDWYFRRKVIKDTSITPIVAQQGVTWYNSDFWAWILAGTTGTSASRAILPFTTASGASYRRNMMLIQYLSKTTFGTGTGAAAAETAATGVLTGIGVSISGGSAASALLGAVTNAAISALANAGIGPFEFAPRIPAKCWILEGCIPVRYKVASDFDAMSSAVSIAEVEMQLESFEELSLFG
jgi:phage tail-like protein